MPRTPPHLATASWHPYSPLAEADAFRDKILAAMVAATIVATMTTPFKPCMVFSPLV
jgi:hypothetical protein